MAIAITMLYILAELIGPGTLFGPLAEYRIELFVALAAVLVSIPSLAESRVLGSRMAFALAGLAFAVAMSIAMGGWLGAIPLVSYGLLPVLLGFLLVAINCRTKRHLQLVILVLFGGAVFDIVNGALALGQAGPSPYIYLQGYSGNLIPRIRGLEFLNDPNDFAQLLVSLIPLLFFFARPDSAFRNKFLIPACAAFLLWGIYLTHSRGGTIALMASIILAAKRRIGLAPAAVVGGLLLVGALALGASGGREISAESGADRIELWAIGLALVRTHFFFGVGLNNFWNYATNTAHNSVVICAAELGVVGLVFWVMFILSTVRGALLLERGAPPPAEAGADDYQPKPHKILSRKLAATPAYLSNGPLMIQDDPKTRHTSAIPMTLAPGAYQISGFEQEKLPDDEIRRMARLLLYSLTGFLAAGWFLSRALSIWLFIYCGMMHAVLRLAANNNIAPATDELPFLLRWSAVIAVALLTIVSIIIRVSH